MKIDQYNDSILEGLNTNRSLCRQPTVTKANGADKTAMDSESENHEHVYVPNFLLYSEVTNLLVMKRAP